MMYRANGRSQFSTPTPGGGTRIRRAVVEAMESRQMLSDAPWTTTVTPAAVPAPVAPSVSPASASPTVTSVTPASGAGGVLRDAFVRASVSVPNGAGIDPDTLTAATVRLTGPGGAVVPASVNTSGGGDVIVLTPQSHLAADTAYTFSVTAGVKDLTKAAFAPFSSQFVTGTEVGTASGFDFTKTKQTSAPAGKKYTGVTFGPDGKLYATALTGEIYRFAVGANGTLGLERTITTISSEGRYLIGLTFDPASTAANPIAWVSHTQATLTNGADWSGKVTRLSGANLGVAQDAVIGLPRSKKDHLTNQLAFGPDGALYFNQGANNAMGDPDSAWGFREERMLSAATLRLDIAAIVRRFAAGQGPLNVRTENATEGGSADDVPGVSAAWDGSAYDPFAAGAPLTLYATGVRNAYDLVWAQTSGNWNLYTPTNGSAPGGTIPATPKPGSYLPRVDQATDGAYSPPATPIAQVANAPLDEPDHLYRIRGPVNGVPSGGVPYLGHPDPVRREYVLNGGNPTDARDRNEVALYPVGTKPDRNYRNADAYEFTNGSATDSPSADGIIQYAGSAFGGALTGRLLMVAYSSSKEIYAARIGANGAIVNTGSAAIQKAAIFDANTGQSMKFTGGVDLVENQADGTIYVADHDGAAIYLLRPYEPAGGPNANAQADKTRLVFSDALAAPGSAARRVTIRNTGTTDLTIAGVSLGGTAAARFTVVAGPSTGTVVPAGGSAWVDLAFDAATTAAGSIQTATLTVTTDDADNPTLSVALRGLSLAGYQGGNEPPLATLLSLYQIPLDVGGTALSLPYGFDAAGEPTLLGDEVAIETLVKAVASAPVTVQPLATFGPDAAPDYSFGFHPADDAAARTTVYMAETAAADPAGGGGQTVHPIATTAGGATLVARPDGPAAVGFDPGPAAFGVWTHFTGVSPNVTAFGEDARNAAYDESSPTKNRRMRFWPLKDAVGNVVPNAYVAGIEEATNNDLQDVVFVIRNVALPGTVPPDPDPVDTTAPRVAGVSVSGTAWDPAIGAYPIASGGPAQTHPVPWANANRISVRFDEHVTVAASALSIVSSLGNYAVTGFDYDAATYTATWTLDSAVPNDRLKIKIAGVADAAGNPLDGEWTDNASAFPSGNGAAGGTFSFAFNVLSADAAASKVVDANDAAAVQAAVGTSVGDAGYSARADLNADGVVDAADVGIANGRIGTRLNDAPFAPMNLTATATSSSAVALAWTPNSNAEKGFKIERATGAAGAFAQVATVGQGVLKWADTGRAASTLYRYRVRAYNASTYSPNSAYANEASATTKAGTTPPPTTKFTVTIQAESAKVYTTGTTNAAKTRAIPPVLAGDTFNAGASGNKYVDFGSRAGDYVQWTVSAPSAGSYRLEFRYANGGTTSRPLALVVNGATVVAKQAFNPSGGWAKWATLVKTLTLKAGTNTIRLAIPAGITSGPNVDFLKVTKA